MDELELHDSETPLVSTAAHEAKPAVEVIDFAAHPSPDRTETESIIVLSPPRVANPSATPTITLKASPTLSRRPSRATQKPPARLPARGSKRKASSPADSAAQTSELDLEPKPTRRRVKQAAPLIANTRSLRSRSSKTEQQIKEEEEAKERIRRALESDAELSDA